MQRLDYQKATERTCPSLGTPAMDHTHMIMGVMDEWYEAKEEIANYKSMELDGQEKIIKEIGDIYWYVANYCRMLNIDFTNGRDIEMPYDVICSKLIGIHKKERGGIRLTPEEVCLWRLLVISFRLPILFIN